MIWGAEVEVALSKIIAPGDLAERMKAPHVVALADTVKRYGGQPGNPLWVTKARLGWRLEAGRDRFAALTINGVKRTKVKPIEDATPEELSDLEEIENLYRRPVENRDELIKARVAKLAARFAAEPELADTRPVSPGRPVTPEGRAREQVAAETGRTKEAVRKAEQRAKKREEGADFDGGDDDSSSRVSRIPPPPIDLHGHEMPPQMADVGGLVKQYAAIAKALGEAKAKAGELDMFASSVKGSNAEIVHAIERVIALVKAETPTDLCPKCKGIQGVRCGLCFESGWVKRDKYTSAPAEQRAAAPKKSRGGVDIVNADGSTTRVA